MTIAIIILSILLLFFVMLYVIFRLSLGSPNKKQRDIFNLFSDEQSKIHREKMTKLIENVVSHSFEEVNITSYDRLKLYGRYYHNKDGAPLAICMHGYRGTAERDMCGSFYMCNKQNYNILLVDQRAHGKSDGRTITFGIKERFDCKSWIEYSINRFGNDVKILLCGVSMGASTVLMASGLALPCNVKGIIADCPFSAPEQIIKKVCSDMKLSPNLFYPLIALSARIYGNVSLSDTTAEKSVAKSKTPTLIIHGEDDRLVPVEMSKAIQKANAIIELHTFPKATHGFSYMVDPERYNKLVTEFIKKVL